MRSPTTFGTWTVVGPFETVNVIVDLAGCDVPEGGDCAITVPEEALEFET
jgi:hypothetical protein